MKFDYNIMKRIGHFLLLCFLLSSSCYQGEFYMSLEVKRVLPTTKYIEGDVITFEYDNGISKNNISLMVIDNSIKFVSGSIYSEEVYHFNAVSKDYGISLSIDYKSHDNILNISFTLSKNVTLKYDRILREEDAISVDNVPYLHIFRIDNRYSYNENYGYLSNEIGFIKFVSPARVLKRIN